jgi:hypothetical protein
MLYMDTWRRELGDLSWGWSLKKNMRSHKNQNLGCTNSFSKPRLEEDVFPDLWDWNLIHP